ncbi:hypothetical protein [Micromonospora polyrhachis]|uniref:Uncharacterized protein n=1 Tax=Micromonospora polyrhachis TaxID=1282883 RepID=A0A7W7SQI6_9ACTN|nr:hypothetical protein [Micromonospora polyrhachis]MBB4959108.1 hypothetical protein [Micromonospora polyrhachis]
MGSRQSGGGSASGSSGSKLSRVLLAVVAASVLLALPTSNAFFHRPRVVDEPLWPGMPYPTPEAVVWPSPPGRGPHQ